MKRQQGFTLIEILLVVVILSTLAALVVPRFVGRSEQAKKMIAEADVNSNIAMALKLYELDNGISPTTEQGLNALMDRPSTSPAPVSWTGPYLERHPVDPWGNPYKYRYPGTHNAGGYDLFSSGQDGQEGTEDDVTNW
ncbi:MAG: type II secretion system major pseudopilin GspG [Candidatus Omnitrophota bacterium]